MHESTLDDAADIVDQVMARIEEDEELAEIAAHAARLAALRRELESQGFSRQEAFALVRDYQVLMTADVE